MEKQVALEGGQSALVHAYKAKVIYGCVNKTDWPAAAGREPLLQDGLFWKLRTASA